MLFVIPILLASGLEIINPLDSLYVLAKKEYIPIVLDNHFIGDELNYSISPNLTEAILKQTNVECTSVRIKNLGLVPQNKVGKMKKIVQDNIYFSKYFVFPNGTYLSMIYINEGDIESFNHSFTNDITSFFVLSSNHTTPIAYVITTGGNPKINKMFHIACTPYGFYLETEINTTDKFKNFTGSSLRFSKGIITETLLASGSYNNSDYIIMFNITHIRHPKLLGEFPLQMQSSKPLLIITYFNIHYIYIPSEKKINKIEIVDQTEIIISDSLYLETNGKDVTSFDLQNELNLYDTKYLILGMIDGFIIITMDFKQIFFKNLGENQGSVHSYPNLYNNVLLLKNNNGYSIKVISSDFAFHVFGGISLNVTDPGISWAIFDESDDGFSLIYTHGENLIINSIILNNAMLNLSSTNENIVYNFSITDKLSNEKFEQTLTVVQPKELGEISPLNFLRTDPLVVFNNFEATLTLNLYDYFYGYKLEVDNVSVDFNMNFFNYSMRNISNHYQKVIIANTELWFKDIVSDTKNTYFYNSSNISILEENQLLPKAYSPVELLKIISCPGYFLINYIIDKISMIITTPILDDIDFSYGYESFCSNFQCSEYYIICSNNIYLYVYNVVNSKLSNGFYNISSSNNQSFSSFYLRDNFTCAIQNQVNFTLYSLNTVKNKVLNVISKELSKPAIDIFAGLDNFFVIYEDYNMEIYDSKGFYLKNISVPCYKKIYYVNNFIVFISEKLLTVYNSTGYIASILIAQNEIGNCTISNAYYNENIGLIIHFVSDSDVVAYNIPLDYSSAFIEFNMADIFSIDRMFYYANITISVKNDNYKSKTTIPIILYTNGQTIYKNLGVIDTIQNNLLNLPCKSSNQISLENMFLGQDLNISVEGSDIFSFNKRISDKILNETIDMNITAFVTVEDFDVYLIATGSVVGVYNKSFGLIDSYDLKEQNTRTNCVDFSVILEDDFFIFSAACNTQIIFYLNTNESVLPISTMYFFRYDNETMTFISNYNLKFSVDSIWGLGKIGGEFLIMILDFYDDMTDGFYCNHLQLILGKASKNSVIVLKLLLISPNDIMMNYYYFIDFEGAYDPIFNIYYLYLLDVYSGIKVLNFSDLPYQHFNLIKTIPLENGSSLMRCGLELYVALQNTTILKYKLQSWDNPELIGKVFPYRDLYTVYPGALKCSEYNYAAYILTLMQDAKGDGIVHVIDNKAQELSSIISDIETNSRASETYAYFYNSTTILVLTPTEVSFYILNEYSLNVKNPDNCHKDSFYHLEITAKNDNIMNSIVLFNVSFKESYSAGDVDLEEIPEWVWGGTGLLFIVLLGVSYKVYQNCMKKRKVSAEVVPLFNYDYDELE
ncbi:hypothetical protein SteCoe_19213 [Stentor coeruleus]|uniref:Uncharacterized protein n=1 Tax=Stentor coeruleus TaxID=5963 RepID=A0A1R2BV34_9CILI|nr:hypothetical protein SteCoe_19213 [Stentor coeruleus]